MKKMRQIALNIVVLVSMLLAPMANVVMQAAPVTEKIQLLATSDLHNHFYPWQYAANGAYEAGSLAKVASVVNEQRVLNPNTILIDNGDTIQDNSSILFLDEPVLPMVKGMNALGYDTWTAGNHEFNYGIPLLENVIDTFDGQFLLSNVYRGDTATPANRLTGAQAYTVINSGNVRVAIIGAVTPFITRWDSAHLQGFTVTDPVAEVQAAVAEIQSTNAADVIIVSFHASLGGEYGTVGMSDSAKEIAEQVPGVDAIICGHEHSVIEEWVGDVPILEPGRYGDYVSKMEFTVTETTPGNYEILNPRADIAIENIKVADYTADPAMLALLQPNHDMAVADSQTVIGKLAGGSLVPEPDMVGITQAQIQDTALVDLILDVQMDKVENSITIPAGAHHVSGAALFDAKANVHAGNFKKSDSASVYKYDNTLMSIKINGSQLKTYMEWSANYYNQFQPGDLTISFNEDIRIYNYDMFAGVDYQVDISKPTGERIANLVYSDSKTPVADTDVVYLTVNNYRVGTQLNQMLHGNFTIEYDSANENISTVRDMVGEYVTNAPNSTIHPTVDNNWEIVGYSWNKDLHQVAVNLVNNGDLVLPTSADGRTPNVRSLTLADIQSVATVIDLVSVNDWHGAAEENGRNIGAAKLAAEVKRLKAANPNTVLLSSGDSYQGSALSNLTKGKVINEIFKLLEVPYSAVGNHEFDWGVDEISVYAQDGGFEFLASNIENKADGSPVDWAKPYGILDINGVRVGLIGLATPETAYKTVPANVEDVVFTDPIEAAKKWETHLRTEKNVDAVIALTHLGTMQAADGTITGEGAELANGVPTLDAIFTAHTHQYVEGVVNGVPVVQGGNNARALSNIKLIFDAAGNKLAVVGTVDRLSDRVDTLPEDPEAAAILATYIADLQPVLDEVIGVADREYTHDTNNDIVTPMGQATAKMMTEISGTDIAIINGGGIRAGMTAGNITMGDMYTLFPFDNTLVTLDVKGSDLKQLIEHGIMPPDFRPGQFYGIDVWYEEEPTATGTAVAASLETGVNITSMRLLDGTPIEMDKTYTITTIDFMVTGGDRYDFTNATNINDTGLPLRDKLADHIRANGGMSYAFAQNLFLGADPTAPGQSGATGGLPQTGQNSESYALGGVVIIAAAAAVYSRGRKQIR